jgi:hypothetical protein
MTVILDIDREKTLNFYWKKLECNCKTTRDDYEILFALAKETAR